MRHLERHVLKKLMKNQDTDCSFKGSNSKDYQKPAAWISLTLIDALKMSCWYVIPTLAIYALGGDLGGVSFAQGLTVTSLMQLLMGVLPTSGGVGSLEVVFRCFCGCIR